jgi:MoaA/NifB/PqqE/SkfB family radical SAM enzyme
MTYPEGVRLVCLPKPPPYVFSADFKITKTYMPLPPKTWFTYCHHLYNYLAVLWNGDVTTCCHDIAGKNILGNLKEESLSEVWHGNKIEALRKRGFCIGCELWQYGYFKTGKSIISLER